MLTNVEARPSRTRTNAAKPRTLPSQPKAAPKSVPASASGEDGRAKKWRLFLEAVERTEKMAQAAVVPRRSDEDEDRHLARLLDGISKLRAAWYDAKGKDVICGLVDGADTLRAENDRAAAGDFGDNEDDDNAGIDRVGDIAEAMRGLRATTMPALAAKALVARWWFDNNLDGKLVASADKGDAECGAIDALTKNVLDLASEAAVPIGGRVEG